MPPLPHLCLAEDYRADSSIPLFPWDAPCYLFFSCHRDLTVHIRVCLIPIFWPLHSFSLFVPNIIHFRLGLLAATFAPWSVSHGCNGHHLNQQNPARGANISGNFGRGCNSVGWDLSAYIAFAFVAGLITLLGLDCMSKQILHRRLVGTGARVLMDRAARCQRITGILFIPLFLCFFSVVFCSVGKNKARILAHTHKQSIGFGFSSSCSFFFFFFFITSSLGRHVGGDTMQHTTKHMVSFFHYCFTRL